VPMKTFSWWWNIYSWSLCKKKQAPMKSFELVTFFSKYKFFWGKKLVAFLLTGLRDDWPK
jgi:hypothetical protein